MDSWLPQSPGIWIGEGSQRLFAVQAPGQWILQDADGAEIRRSRTLAGLVAEHGSVEPSQGASTPSWGSASGFSAGPSRGDAALCCRATATRGCARLSARRLSTCRCAT